MTPPNEASTERAPVIRDLEIIAETPELRVVRIGLEPGETIPWHSHTQISDRFFCTEGEMTVETRAPRQTHRLTPGSDCMVPARTAHVVTNVGAAPCRFVLVQGIGAYDRVPEDAPDS